MSDLAETVLYILGITIATFCDRSDQRKLIKLYPFITHNSNISKWKLFNSQSLQHYINTTAVPVFTQTFKPINDFDFDSPFSVTIIKLNNINSNDVKNISIPLSKKSYPFDSFKSFVIILIIEQFYKIKFRDYKYGNCLNCFNRNTVNPIINIEIDRNKLYENVSKKYSDYDNFVNNLPVKEKGCLLHIFKNSNEKFEYELKVIKETNTEMGFEWFKNHLNNIKNNKYKEEDNDPFSYLELLNGRFNTDNEFQLSNLNVFCDILNNIFLSELDLFSDLIIMYGEESFESFFSSNSNDKYRIFATMDILLVAISSNFDKVVLIQCLLEKRILSLKSSEYGYNFLYNMHEF